MSYLFQSFPIRLLSGYTRAISLQNGCEFDSSVDTGGRSTATIGGFFASALGNSSMDDPSGESKDSPVPVPGLSTRSVSSTSLTGGARPFLRRTGIPYMTLAQSASALPKHTPIEQYELFTPELYFVPHPAATEIQVDALYCALLRAEAIVCMLQGQFNGSGGNRYNDDIITNALWAVEGCIEQAKTIVQHPSSVRASEVQ